MHEWTDVQIWLKKRVHCCIVALVHFRECDLDVI